MAQWTDEQFAAITSRGSNLLVAAAAGSGKTAVLVERIIKRICDPEDPVDIDRLLVVTFTSLAAAEMKERIGLAITKALKENPLSKHLYRQSTLLNKASIMTLHSFCLEIVRENFYRIGIDPSFRIADDTEAQLLQLDALEDLLERYYQRAQDGDEFIQLIDSYGGQRDDVPIQELIIKLYLLSRSNPWPQLWLDRVTQSFTANDWFSELLPSLTMELEAARSYLVQGVKYSQNPSGPQGYLTNLQEEIAYIDDLIVSSRVSWEELYKAFPQGGFKRLPSIKKGTVNEDHQSKVKELREKAKGKIKDMESKYFLRSPQDLLDDLARLTPHLEILSQLVKEFGQEYQERKAKKNLVDFSDLEHFCLQILLAEDCEPGNIVPSSVSLKLKERFVEVLVDEYQDINDVQETLLQLVTGESNMFMVGDVKQSIYRFRLAKPELFLEKYKSFDSTTGTLNRRIDLAKNFRCSRQIVEAVNYIFSQVMSPQVGEITYDKKAQLVYGATVSEDQQQFCQQHPVEFYLLEKKASEEAEEDLSPIEREAHIIGQQILEMIDQKQLVLDKATNKYRPITYRDIVILLRSPKGMIDQFADRFQHLGIPLYAEMGSGYFSAMEVQTMLALLRVIDNPRQDIPLAGVLRSPLVGLTAQDLAHIRVANPLISFYEGVVKASMGTEPLALRLQKFLKSLEKWRTLARQSNLANLIWTLYRETGYLDYVGALPGGVGRQANLRALHDRARQYEATSFRGLFRFLRFIERLEDNKGDLEAAKALSENENVVRVMSIHKSKGLEFPVVFVAGLGKKFNLSDGYQDVVIHKDLGLGLVFIDSERRVKYPTISKLAIENKMRLETLAEEMRVLYVALTRARERLILIGSVNNLSKKLESWCEILTHGDALLPDSYLAQAQTYLDWLGLALIRHHGAQALREAAQYQGEGMLLTDQSTWQMGVFKEDYFTTDHQEVATSLEHLEDIKELKATEYNSPWSELVHKRLSWQYPHKHLLGIGAKVTVSEIKHKFQELSQDQQSRPYYDFHRRPAFLQREKGLSAQEKGSALHLVMEQINLDRAIDETYLEELLVSLEEREILTPGQRAAINKPAILQFFKGNIGQRLQNASQVKREVPFSLAIPAAKVYGLPEETQERVILQGIIDCMWQEDGAWILLDYKTDGVTEEKVAELVDKYTGQINLYTQAIEGILKKPVKERYIYLFNVGKEVAL